MKLYPFESNWYKGIDFDEEAERFLEELNAAEKESDVQRYIKQGEKWFIPGSIFQSYDFGHHEAWIGPEWSLGGEYYPDYMLLGRNSASYHIVFVEFEGVKIEFVQKNSNTETKSVRDGLTQIRDWRVWVDENLGFLKRGMMRGNDKLKIDYLPLSAINYCMVIGRRRDMDDRARRLRNELMRENGLKIITFDRLVEDIKTLSRGF